MRYFTKFPSLVERASIQVAINLCQDNGFKEVALCLEKPTYGSFVYLFSNHRFITDPELLSAYDKEIDRRISRMEKNFMNLFNLHVDKKVEQWYAAVNEHCQRLTEGLPQSLKFGIHAWINRIAMEFLSYSRMQELLFGVPCHFVVDILTQGNWIEFGQLDHMKLAKKLLENERLPLLQRYRIACVYWFPEKIFQLWRRLTLEEKLLVTGEKQYNHSKEKSNLVLHWSHYMNAYEKEKVIKRVAFEEFLHEAMDYGNRGAVKRAWKELEANTRDQKVSLMAMLSLQGWLNIGNDDYGRKLIWYDLPSPYFNSKACKNFNLPYHYSDLLHFFLSEMHEEQQLMFFKEAFQIEGDISILECFLEWHFRENFLHIVNRLWGIIPMYKYRCCLLSIVCKCCCRSYYKSGKHDCDYESLFFKLWEETPEDYKQYIFTTRGPDHDCNMQKKKNRSSADYPKTVMEIFMIKLIKLSSLNESDTVLFKNILCTLPKEERKKMVFSDAGEEICTTIIEGEKLHFVKWLLEECLSSEEISIFKKKLTQSNWINVFCLQVLLTYPLKYVEDVIDWAFESDAEKMKFRCKLLIF